ncbi:AraC family transcriptional regulator [Evansella sp. AB-P1]|uniref:AraC family transcriptional regulator n=1 Tax=Evansella sp. AB-P1 TaxID=3037653 RepID=UPI00241FB081|nr:AraC family transcriptional regulator [Evansella sp. AB-P1]MDG5789441.1 AraC family transcriptional regulator [Evansella sp. AB-P1]
MDYVNIFNDLSEHVMIHINSCSEISHTSSWIESKHHPDFDLWYLYKGKIEIHIQEKVYQASEGDLILFSPKIAYTATALSSECSFIFTHFDFVLGNHFGILDNFQLSGIISNKMVKEESRLFLDTFDQYKLNTPMSGIRLKGCFTILIAKIIELYGIGKYQGEFKHQSSVPKQKMGLQNLQLVFDFIQNHLHQTISIGELAVIAGMSEKYFFYYFKQSLGITPSRYIYQLRMNRARELLYSNRYSIKQIAEKLGYPDPYSFSKAFKKYYKVPPSQFV